MAAFIQTAPEEPQLTLHIAGPMLSDWHLTDSSGKAIEFYSAKFEAAVGNLNMLTFTIPMSQVRLILGQKELEPSPESK